MATLAAPRRSGRRRSRGFTLVEILVVVAVLAVIAAIAIPNVQGVMESYRLQTATSMLASKLNEARMNALKRNRSVWLELDVASGRALVRTTGSAGSTLELGAPGLLPSGVSFADPVVTIRFDSVGRPTNPPPRVIAVQITRSGARRSVSVSPSGMVRRQ